MASEHGRDPGLFASLKGFAATGVEIAYTRLELFSTEVVEEKERLLALLAYGLAALFFISLGIIFFAIFVTVAFWNSHRLLVLGMFTVLFCGAGVVAYRIASRYLHAKSRPFSASLAELSKDRAHLNRHI